MWRSRGDILFGVVILLVLAQEAVGFVGITWAFALSTLHRGGRDTPWWILVAVLVMALAAMLLLVAYMIFFHLWSEAQDARRTRLMREWAEVWAQALTTEAPVLPARFPSEATQALLRLGDALTGQGHARVRELARRSGIEAAILKKLRSRRVPARMEALEVIALGRLEGGFDGALIEMKSSHPGLSMMGARACARTLAAVESQALRVERTMAFVQALSASRLSEGAMRECLLLTEEVAPEVIASILANPPVSELVLSAAVETVGHLQIRECGSAILPLLARGPELRAAVLRAVARLRTVPADLAPALLAMLDDPTEFVRAHAARVAALTPSDAVLAKLWERLGDASWWVRRAAAQSLLEMGNPGREQLARAAKDHPDRFAREAAGIASGTLSMAEAA